MTIASMTNGTNSNHFTFVVFFCGRKSNINDRHNWDSYFIGQDIYTLNVQDMKKLQGFPESFVLEGPEKQKEMMLGNTIPTNMTYVVGEQLINYL